MIYHAEDRWNGRNDELCHINGFKYIKKIPIGKTFRYFYSQAELAAYMAGKTINHIRKTANTAINEYVQKNKVWKPLHHYTKKGETVYFDKAKIKNKDHNLQHIPGVDPKGYKYVAKMTSNGQTRYFYSEEEYEAFKNRQFYQDPENEPDFLKAYKENSKSNTSEQDLISVNPNIAETKNGTTSFSKNPDYTMNCTECTMVYEMRRRGYDVEYNTKYNISGADVSSDSLIYNTNRRFSYCFEKPTTYAFKRVPNEKSFNSFMKTTYPPNSRGDLTVTWKEGGGHSMIWETDSHGNVTIKDAQMSGTGAPTVYKPSFVFNKSIDVNVTRLDNLKPKKGITKVIQNKQTPNNKALYGYELGTNNDGLTKRKYSISDMYKKYS